MRIIGAVTALAVLGGCSLFGVGYDIERMRTAQGTGDAFTRALTDEYRQLTVFEADEMYDWPDAGLHARKGLRAAAGEVVQPEAIEDWSLPADKVGELTVARGELVAALDANARAQVPALAARAQGQFDCWIEQQEENHQPEHIAACRDGFHAAMAEIKAAMAPKPKAEPAPEPEPAPAPPAPERFVVFFAFDSAELSTAALETIGDAVRAARETGAVDISVTGHADRAGPEDYNLRLSLRRANAVRDALIARGIPGGRIGVAGRGEAEPAVATADGAREPANRRVEIIVVL